MKTKLTILLTLLAIPMMVIADDIDVMPWSMYQQNASHTGYVDAKIDLATFSVDWKVFIGDNPNGEVTRLSQPVVDGNVVYVSGNNGDFQKSSSLQAFNIRDGHQIWKKEFNPGWVNPPSVVNGIVYVEGPNTIQSNISHTETALYGYNAETGKILFKTLIYLQWGSSISQNYLSPTIFDDTFILMVVNLFLCIRLTQKMVIQSGSLKSSGMKNGHQQ